MTRSVTGRKGQQGAALLIALLTVALAMVLATELLERSQRELARTRAVAESERAWQFATGLEGLARDWVRRARESGVGAELLNGRWSQPFEVAGGMVRARLLDQGGRFNLNAMASADPEQALAATLAFHRLLRELDLDKELSEAVRSSMRPPGASRPTPLAHWSELERLEIWTPAIRERLLPFITILPDAGTRLNLNLAAPQVLAAWIDGLGPEQAAQLTARVPFESLDRALAEPELAQLDKALLARLLSTRSDWFMVHAQVTLDGETRNFYNLMHVPGKRYDARYTSLGIP